MHRSSVTRRAPVLCAIAMFAGCDALAPAGEAPSKGADDGPRDILRKRLAEALKLKADPDLPRDRLKHKGAEALLKALCELREARKFPADEQRALLWLEGLVTTYASTGGADTRNSLFARRAVQDVIDGRPFPEVPYRTTTPDWDIPLGPDGKETTPPKGPPPGTKEGKALLKEKLAELAKLKGINAFHKFGLAHKPYQRWHDEVQAATGDKRLTLHERVAAGELVVLANEYRRSKGAESRGTRYFREAVEYVIGPETKKSPKTPEPEKAPQAPVVKTYSPLELSRSARETAGTAVRVEGMASVEPASGGRHAVRFLSDDGRRLVITYVERGKEGGLKGQWKGQWQLTLEGVVAGSGGGTVSLKDAAVVKAERRGD